MAKIKQSKLNEIKGYNEYKKRKEEKEQKAQKEESAAQAASPSTSNTKTTSSTTSNKTNTTSNKTSTTSNATISSTTKGAKIKQSKLDSIKGYNAYKARREARERNAQVPPNSTPVADKTKLNDGYTIESIRENLGYSQTALEDSIKRLEESKNVLTSSENEVTNFLKKYGATAEDIHSKMATKYGAKLDTSGKYIFEDEQSYSDYQKEIAALGALYDQYNANMNQYNALYTQYQDSAVNYEDWYGRLEGYQPRDATLKDLLWNSLKQGYYNSVYGQESYKQMLGDENQAAAYKELLSGEDYQFETDNWLEKAVSGAANQLGQQYRQWTDPRSLASGTAFAGGAFALGQAGPQALVPEEVITVPGAFIAGMQAGSAASNFEIEGGLAYQEMLEQGISPEVARIIGLSVGGGNAALEALQADELIKGLKVFNNKQGYESVAELLYAELKRRFPNLANQVIQEVAQEGVTIGGTQLASYIDKGELAYTMPETLQRLGETALSSTLTFGLMDVPGATMNVAANKANVNRLGKIGSEYNVDAEAVIAEGLEMPKNTEAYQTAVELKAKVDAGQTVSDAELGRAVVANEMAIQQNQVTEEAAQPAEKAQKALENLARDAVAYRENFQQAEPTQSETVSEQATVPYNVMADTNPVRQKKVAETRSLEKKLGYGEEGLKLFKEIAAETNVDTDELMVRFDTPYQAGLTGLPMAKANLVDNFQTEAYNAGRMDNIARMAKDKESKPATIYSEAESGFDFTNAPSDLTQEQKDFAVFFNKAMGVKGEFNGYEGVNYNAKYSKSTGVVAFAQDFGIDSKLMKKLGSMEYQQKVEKLVETRGKSFIFYFAHEVADHVASNRAPAAMRAFNNAMYNYQQSKAGSENLARSKQAFYGDNKVDLSTEGAIEEVGADSILMLYDGDEKKFMDAMRRVLNGDNQQAKEGAKIYKNKLDEVIQKLKAWFRKLTGKENAEARANLKQGITELEQLRDMFEQAIAEAAKNVKAARGLENRGKQEYNGSNKSQLSLKNEGELTHDELSSVFAYKSGGSYLLNAMLYTGAELNDYYTAMRDNLDAALEKLPVHTGTVYRNLGFDDFGGKEAMDAFVAQHAEGEPIRYGSYPSSSKVADGHPIDGEYVVNLEIESVTGRDMEGFGNNFEDEVLFGRKTWFIPTKITVGADGRPLIVMKEAITNGTRVHEGRNDRHSGRSGSVQQRAGAAETARTEVREVREVHAGNADVQAVPGRHPGGDPGRGRNLSEVSEENVKYSLVTDKETLDFLNGQKLVKVYRAMQEIDGKLYPPMAALIKSESGKKQLVEDTKKGAWYQADEHPELIKLDKNGKPKFELNKGNGGMVPAAYNPYFHTSASPLNDQFSSAYDRPNIVVVEGYIPESELTSGYKAQYAKDSVGETAWHAGPVASKLKGAKARRVFLSRWFKAERVVPVDEVAKTIAKTLQGENVSVPWNVVTPSLREALEKQGVEIDYKDVKMGNKVVSFDNQQYSLKDSDGNTLSKEQAEYFKDSKVRDEKGRLVTVYHSSPTAGFTVFNGEQGNGNYRFSEYGTGITFFTDNKEMAASYGNGEGGQYEGYLNITKPYVVDAKGRFWDRVSSEFSQGLYEQMRDAFTAEEKAALISLAGWEDFAAFNEEVSRAVRDSGKPTADKNTKILNSAFWKCADMAALFSMASENFSDDVIRRNSYMDLTTNEIVEKALQDGSYDGVIIKNVIDYGVDGLYNSKSPTGTDYIIFNSNQFKAKDNKNPTEDPDIRYSIKSTAAAAGLDVTRDEKGKVVFKLDGKVVTKVTPEHIQKNSGLGGLITVAAIKGHITDAEAVTQYTAMADIMNMIMNTQDPDLVWAWVGASMFSALKKNADGQYGTTIDFTTVCRKTQDIITAMSRAMMKMKRGLSKDEVTKLQAELITEGSSVPCPVCYVFSRWAGIGSILDNMYRWQEKYDGYTDEQLRKRVDELTEKLGKGKVRDLKKMLREQDEEYDSLDHESEMLALEKKQLTAKRKKAIRENIAHMLRSVDDRMKEVEKRIPQVKKRMSEIQASVAPELAWLLQVRTNPDYAKHGKVKPNVLFNLDDAATFAESYPLAWKYRTSRGPSAGKAILPYSDMRLGDMILGVDSNSATGNDLFANVTGQFTDEQMEALDKAIKRTKAQNLIGGQRFQSTSDFRYDYALDYLMAFFECQALGSKLQTYTKIIEFADMVAAVRGDVNLSVMPKNKGYITTSDGVNRLVFSSVTGIDFEAAQRANELHDSAQLILVGINDEHILAALEDSEETLGKHIGFVIPYHASGASINEFIRVLVSNLGESFTLNYYQDYSDVQSDKERSNATDAQKRRNELRSKLLKGKDGGKNWEPSEDDLAFIRGKSVDISGKSFADLRSIERKALSGNKAAIAEYESWTAGALWDLYNKMWVDGGAEYGVRLNTNQAKAVMPHEYWNKTVNRDKAYINGFLFRSYCYNLGLTPRFSGATVKGEKHGDFTDSKGYWKTLIDRPMYNNDGTYRDQQTVNVSSFQKDMLTQEYAKKHWDGYSVQEPDVVRAGRAADRFIEKSQNGQYSLKGEHEMRREIDRIRKAGAKAGKSQTEIDTEVMGVVGPEYGKLLKTYGEIERGEKPYREISVPRRTEKGRKVSQTIRTVLEAEVTPDAAVPTLQELITQGDFSYDVYTDKVAIATAEATIRNKGYETALADWLSDVKEGKVNKTNTALGWALYNAAATKGDFKTAMTILNGMVRHQRNAAQALQATRILKKMSPEAQLYGIQKTVDDINEELQQRYGEKPGKRSVSDADNVPVELWMQRTGELLAEQLGKAVKKKTRKEKTVSQRVLADLRKLARETVKPAAMPADTRTEMDSIYDMFNNKAQYEKALAAAKETVAKEYGNKPEIMSALDKWMNTAFDYTAQFTKEFTGQTEIQIPIELVDKFLSQPDQDGRDAVAREIYRYIGSQMPSRFIDKWNAWRYLAMLGNPRTHVRNVVGNLGFAPVVMAKDMTATAIESAVSFVSGGKMGRTKAMPSLKLLKAAWADYANVADQVTAGGKYSDSAMKNQHIEEGRQIFKFKPLEKARKGNSAAMETEDMWFAQPHYAFALAQYCKAHGVTVDQLRAGKALGNGRDYAIREAQKATYRDTNAFSQTISELGRYHGDNKVKKGVSIVMEGILPFRKTPANILVRGIEYSPVGFVKGMTYDLYKVSKGELTAAEAIDNISAGLTGTGLLGLGIYMAAEGLIRGAGGDDEEEKKFEEMQGHQAYALELPDGKSITLDWLAPEVLPLFIGVNLYETARENKGMTSLSDILSAVSNVTEPLLEMSCLQSLNDLFDSVGYAASGNGLSALPTILASAATSYLTQVFPTILGQAERSAQDERMTTYTEKNGFLTSDMQYTLGKISAKLPGWDFNQIPYVDAWGRTESTGSKASNIANNFLNPAYTSQIETSEMEEELARLHDEKGDEYSVLPSRPKKYFNVDGERKDLTGEEYVEYATEKGQLSYDILTDLTGQKEYDKLPDAEKARAVELAFEYANAIAKSNVSDYEPDSWVAKALEAEEFSGMDETEYILYKVALSMADQDNNGNNNYDNTEKAAAIASMPSLSDADIAVLLDSKTSYAAYDAGVDMRSLMGYIGEGNDVNVEKLIGAKEAGISEDTYFKYTDTLKAVDQPNSNGELGGAATNAEKAAAVAKMRDLDNEGIAYLWGTDQAHEAHSYGVDMRKYAQFKGVVGDFKGQDKQQQIKSYLKSMNLSAKDYLYLYGTVYSSVKDDADYLYYFGN